ncbi:MAG: hypothetical protein JW822_01910 [Spirochaetales bacterium]|nr:hypothetical protein [Spirochaetales bacterium]
MNRKKTVFTIILLFVICHYAAAQKVRFTVNTSHTGAVTSLASRSESDLLFSGGTDGTVKIWNIQDKKLYYNIQLSAFPILGLALHPQKNELLALTKDNMNSHVIIAINWKTAHILYTISLNSTCLHFDYSPQGTYFFACTSHWNGFALFNAITGERLCFLPDRIGMISYAAISRKEKNIMTYNPSGKITYWNIAKAQSIKELTTLSDIRHPFITQDKNFLIGYSEDTLVVIDLLTGALKALLKLPHIIDLAYNSENQEIAYIAKYNKKQTVGFVNVNLTALTLTKHPAEINSLNSALTKTVYVDRLPYFGGETGSILFLKDKIRMEQFAKPKLLIITDLTAFNSLLAVTASNNVIFLSSELFAPEADFPYPQFKKISFVVNKLTLPFADSFLEKGPFEDTPLIAWQNDKLNAKYAVIDPVTLTIVKQQSFKRKVIVHFSLDPRFLHIVSKNGQLLLVSRQTYEPVFRYSADGMNTLAILSEDELILGKNRGTKAGSALMRINYKKNKASAIPISSQVILHIIKNPHSFLIYTAGFEEIDNSFYTVIKACVGDNFEQNQDIFKLPGEHYRTRMKYFEETETLYFTITGDTIYIWNGFEVDTFSDELRNIKEFSIADNHLYVLHKDSSISVWHITKRKQICQIYLLSDCSWVVTVHNGQYFTSDNGASNVNIFKK